MKRFSIAMYIKLVFFSLVGIVLVANASISKAQRVPLALEKGVGQTGPAAGHRVRGGPHLHGPPKTHIPPKTDTL
jgi:hypothetical protein